MNHALAEMLQQLHLAPGIYRYELPEHEVVVQILPRKAHADSPSSEKQSEQNTAESAIDESCIMLDPWVELPRPKPIGRVVGRPAPLPPPDIPEIPSEDEMP